MEERNLIKAFFNCGDNRIIEFSIIEARLNKTEKEVLRLMFDECLTQEQIAEEFDISTRKVQDIWYSANRKLLSLPWVIAYSSALLTSK